VPPRTAQAQIVATLMQFPSVRGVTIEVDGKPVPLENGAGEELTRPATDEDYVDLTTDALIFVRAPARDSTVTSPVRAAGTANVFEATFQVEIWSGGKLLDTKTITATSGSGTPGTWQTRLALPPGEARLVFYDASAKDGTPLHETEVLLHVR
jgi:Immunoglobulin-like domain of bacterial spore germination/Sporulation and spore germination